MEAIFNKVNGALHPVNESDREILKKFPAGRPVRVKITKVRNYEFLKKYFALLNLAFDYWEPPRDALGEKNFERFRKDIIILAGFYDTYVRVDGSIRIEPRSIAFGSMDAEEFEDLYTKTIDALVKHVLPQFSGDELREIARAIEDFDT